MLRPMDLPVLRAEIRDWYATSPVSWYWFKEALGDEWGPPATNDPAATRMVEQALRTTVQSEARRLAAADLFYVDAGMFELAQAAAESLPEFRLCSSDASVRSGFMFFAAPMTTLRDDHQIRAVHWTIDDTCLATVWFADREAEIAAFPSDAINDDFRRMMPRLRPLQVHSLDLAAVAAKETVRIWNSLREEWVSPATATGTVRWLAILKTVWLLMAQPVGEVSDAVYDRPARRRFQREGRQPPLVRVITLRRPAGEKSTGESDREWKHRWMVRGHWRLQPWGPKREQVRPVWIAPHIKGPEDKPLIGGEKVYHLKR